MNQNDKVDYSYKGQRLKGVNAIGKPIGLTIMIGVITVIVLLVLTMLMIQETRNQSSFQSFIEEEIGNYNSEMVEVATIVQSEVQGISQGENRLLIDVEGQTLNVKSENVPTQEIQVGDNIEYREYEQRYVTDKNKEDKVEEYETRDVIEIHRIVRQE